jgi:hypothetical protein
MTSKQTSKKTMSPCTTADKANSLKPAARPNQKKYAYSKQATLKASHTWQYKKWSL